MLQQLKTIFESVDKDLLNEETLQSISALVEETVNKKVEERVSLELEAKLTAQDEDHAAKFQNAIQKLQENIDKDHTAKVKTLVEAINKDHVDKLLHIKEKYETALKETAVSHRDTLVQTVSKFLDVYIEKNLPTEQIAEAAKNQFVTRQLKQIREVVGVDESFIKQNVKEALVDGKRQVDQLVKENAQLKKSQLITESKKLLAEKTANLPASQKRFVLARLEGKSPEFIKENFQYVVTMYARQEKADKRQSLNNGRTNNIVDRARVAGEIIKESSENAQNTGKTQAPNMDLYMEGMTFRK